MNKSFYVGNLRSDALNGQNRNWVVGTFLQDPQRQADQMEVKYWEYAKGETVGHGIKTSETIEWTYILKGKTRAILGEDVVTLHAGEYVLIHPGTPNNTVAEILEDTQGITVKSPSDPNAKKLITP